jgi:hypothetical protein
MNDAPTLRIAPDVKLAVMSKSTPLSICMGVRMTRARSRLTDGAMMASSLQPHLYMGRDREDYVFIGICDVHQRPLPAANPDGSRGRG